jgi:diamine N-acetyltransferase
MRPSIHLRPITAENWEEVVALRLSPGQKHLFAPNWYSLLQAQYEGGEARAIYAGSTIVGFAHYVLLPQASGCQLLRFMIDQEFQGFGYGRAALGALIEHLSSGEFGSTIWLTVAPGNTGAVSLFESAGFVATGQMDFDEAVYQLVIR